MVFDNINTSEDLIDAITAANIVAGPHIIRLISGKKYVFNSRFESTLNALPIIEEDISIIGNNSSLVRDLSGTTFRFFTVASSGVLRLRGITLRYGGVTEDGGAIANDGGSLELKSCKILDCEAYLNQDGGGLYNVSDGSITTVINSILARNKARSGGAISIIYGKLNVINCEIFDNIATGNGGGIHVYPFDTNELKVIGCKIYNNKTQLQSGSTGTIRAGGAIAALAGKVYIANNDFYGNSAYGNGQCIYCDGSLVSSFTSNVSIIDRNRIHDHNSPWAVVVNPSNVDINALNNWWGATTGPTVGVSGSGERISSNINYVPFEHLDEPTSDADCGCIVFSGKDCDTGPNPISLRLGEKRLTVSDLTVQTPAGALTFTREYRQSKQTDAEFQLMGLGWTHNHRYILFDQTSNTPPQITLTSPDGGSVFFNYDSTTDRYRAALGSTSEIEIDTLSTIARYTMTSGDKRTYEFDADKKLRKITWPSGEYWTYHYYGDLSPDEDNHFAFGELKEVIDAGYEIDDDPSLKRKLQFVYLENPTFDDDGTPVEYENEYVLWRIGDHTATDLDTIPSGRYIELGYTPERDDGEVVAQPMALLATVSDVRDDSRLWIYNYYGQNDEEDLSTQLNWLISRETPEVDLDGDQVANVRLTPEKLTYQTFPLERIVDGEMDETDTWQTVGVPSTFVSRSTVQVASGTYSRRIQSVTLGDGMESNLWRLAEGRRYTITAKIYVTQPGGSPQVKMHVTGTTVLDRFTSSFNTWETLTITDYIPDTTMDCKLQFLSSALDNASAIDFFVDDVSVLETNLQITQQRGLTGTDPQELIETIYTFTPTLNQTMEVTAGLETAHQFEWGMYKGLLDPAGNQSQREAGTQFRVNNQVDANQNTTALDWSMDGKYLNAVIDAAGSETQFSYNENDTLDYSIDAEGRKTEYIYGDTVNNPRLPTEIKVIDTDNSTVLRWQVFEYDVKGRVLLEALYDPSDPPPSGTPVQSTEREYYTDGYGAGLLKKVIQLDGVNDTTTEYQYDILGRVIEVKNSSTFGDCCGTKTEYDDAGNISSSTNIRDWNAGNDPIKNPVTTYGYDEIGRRVRVTTNVGTDFEQISLTFYDALNRVIRTISNYNNPIISSLPTYTAPGGWEWNGSAWVDATSLVISHGGANTQNSISDTEYNARGMVRLQRETLGNVTLYGYNDAGRLIKTIQNASNPNYNNDYVNTSPDPGLADYEPVGDVDSDIIATSFYDPVGNVVKTVSPLGNAEEDEIGYTTLTGYDALNRPVKVIRNASQPDYDLVDDPQLADYIPSLDPDKDVIDVTEYNAMGRVFQTQRLLENRPEEQWVVTRTVYDGLGRQVKVIQNYVPQNTTDPLDWVWANDRWEDGASNAIDHGERNDQNLITETIYDANGRVQETRNVLGTLIRPAYDGLGRQVKNVAVYVVQGSTDPVDWVWDTTDQRWEDGSGNAISFGTANDQNIINETVYDGNGQVQQTRDVLGRVSYTVYDEVGRAFRTIRNYVPQGSNSPVAWTWDAITHHRWEDSAGNPIDFGANNDQNLISETIFDDRGRVIETYDKRHNVMRSVYDELGRRVMSITNYIPQSSDPENWIWDAGDGRWEDGAGNAISFGTDNDQNRISTTTYDLVGWVISSRDAAGVETVYYYDHLGRRLKSVSNYIEQGSTDPTDWVWDAADNRWEDGAGNAISFGTDNDQNLISETVYNKVGQVLTTRDARGTQSAFAYEKAGRRLLITEAVETGLESKNYTCYDKAGRVLRTIANYIPLYSYTVDDHTVILYESTGGTLLSPDEHDESGQWVFIPPHNGDYNDRNLITEFKYDLASRRFEVIDPVGNTSQTTYYLDGQVEGLIDPMNMETKYRYDRLRRRFRVVQGYIEQDTSDPQDWVMIPGTITPTTQIGSWKQSSSGPTIEHGDNNDENIIVDVSYDLAGRVTSQFNPHAFETAYDYDDLDRRWKLTNMLGYEWITQYGDLTDGKSQTTLSYPGVADDGTYDVVRDFDRLGRLTTIDYDDDLTTAKVTMTYDTAGNRTLMAENNGTSDIRKTHYNYDTSHRLINVEFDPDGLGTSNEEVSYTYDVGGLRTQLTMPGDLEIQYTYDAKGQLVSLGDWDDQTTRFAYDSVGRHIATERANRLRSRYLHDTAGRLRQLRHSRGAKTVAHFGYEVDARGNRTQALEALAKYGTGTTTIASTDPSIIYKGTWSTVSSFKESTEFTASLAFLHFGSNNVTLKMGQGPDHSIYDIYIGGTLWQSINGYAASTSEQTITIPLQGDGPYLFEIRNRAEKTSSSSGYKVRFKSLAVDILYDLHTITYDYDSLSRVKAASYYAGQNIGAPSFRQYDYTFDRAGNRTQQVVTVAGTPTATDYDYNAINQLVDDGPNSYAYDPNGNLWKTNSSESHSWDQANRLLSFGSASHVYDGEGRRVQQALSSTVTKYLLDIQPGLSVVLSQDEGGDVTRFVHAPRGIHARQDNDNLWHWTVQDGLSTVRMETDNSVVVEGTQDLDPFGNVTGVNGTIGTRYGFTGELVDGSGLIDLRARRYNSAMGAFITLDPFEGTTDRAMSLNGYGWVEGNVTNLVDPTGLCISFNIPGASTGCLDILNEIILSQDPNKTGTLLIQYYQCQDLLSSNEIQRNKIKSVSAIVALGCYYDGSKNTCLLREPNCSSTHTEGCRSNENQISSLGTLVKTDSFTGIVTHAHFGKMYGDVTNASVLEMLERMQSFDWIEFRGINGVLHLKTEEITNILGRHKPEVLTISLDDSQITKVGSTITSIGSSLLSKDSSVLFAYRDPLSSPNRGWDAIMVEKGELFQAFSNPGLVQEYQVITDKVLEGTSGGGLFNLNTHLIGVAWKSTNIFATFAAITEGQIATNG